MGDFSKYTDEDIKKIMKGVTGEDLAMALIMTDAVQWSEMFLNDPTNPQKKLQLREYQKDILRYQPVQVGETTYERQARVVRAGRGVGKCRYAGDFVTLATGERITFKELLNRNPLSKSFSQRDALLISDTLGNIMSSTRYKVFPNGKRNAYRLTTKTGTTEVSTPNHRYLIYNNYGVQEVELGDLVKGDKILNIRYLPVFGNKKKFVSLTEETIDYYFVLDFNQFKLGLREFVINNGNYDGKRKAVIFKGSLDFLKKLKHLLVRIGIPSYLKDKMLQIKGFEIAAIFKWLDIEADAVVQTIIRKLPASTEFDILNNMFIDEVESVKYEGYVDTIDLTIEDTHILLSDLPSHNTVSLVVDALYYALTNSYAQILIVAPHQQHLTPVIDALRNMFYTSDLSHMKVRDKQSPFFELTFTNGSIIRAITAGSGGGRSGVSIRGQSAHRLYLDECVYKLSYVGVSEFASKPIEKLTLSDSIFGGDETSFFKGNITALKSRRAKVISISTPLTKAIMTPNHPLFDGKKDIYAEKAKEVVVSLATRNLKFSSEVIRARMAGYLYGDGWICQTTKEVGFSGQKEDLEQIIEDAVQLGARRMHSYERLVENKERGIKGIVSQIGSTWLYGIFKDLVPEGKKVEQPLRVPPAFKKGKDYIKASFLSGLFSAEATHVKCQKNGVTPRTIDLKMRSMKESWLNAWFTDLIEMLTDLGIETSGPFISPVEDKFQGEIRVRNSKENIDQFIKKVGFCYDVSKAISANKWKLYRWYKKEYDRDNWKKNRLVRAALLEESSVSFVSIWKKIPRSTVKYHKKLYDPLFSEGKKTVEEIFEYFKYRDHYVTLPIIKAARREVGTREVINLTSTAAHRFFAQGMLTHNCDYMDAKTIEAVMAISQRFHETAIWASSTPTGKRVHFWSWCTDKSLGFKEFHQPSWLSPTWNPGKEKMLKGSMSDLAYTHEFCLAPETPILTSKGEKSIRDIVPGDRVLCAQGRLFANVTASKETGRKDIVRHFYPNISTKEIAKDELFRYLDATVDHKIATHCAHGTRKKYRQKVAIEDADTILVTPINDYPDSTFAIKGRLLAIFYYNSILNHQLSNGQFRMLQQDLVKLGRYVQHTYSDISYSFLKKILGDLIKWLTDPLYEDPILLEADFISNFSLTMLGLFKEKRFKAYYKTNPSVLAEVEHYLSSACNANLLLSKTNIIYFTGSKRTNYYNLRDHLLRKKEVALASITLLDAKGIIRKENIKFEPRVIGKRYLELPILKREELRHDAVWNITINTKDHCYNTSDGVFVYNCAEFGEAEAGVFQQKYIFGVPEVLMVDGKEKQTGHWVVPPALVSYEKKYGYQLGDLPYNQTSQYFIGVDWNGHAKGTHFVIMEWDGKELRIVKTIILEGQVYHEKESMELVIHLNNMYHPVAIYCDSGYGATKNDILSDYAEKNKGSMLKERLKFIDFGGKLTIWNRATDREESKYTKPFMVDVAVMIMERGLYYFDQSSYGTKNSLIQQIIDYQVSYSPQGRPIFHREGEGGYDHTLDAWLLASLAFENNVDFYKKPKVTFRGFSIKNPYVKPVSLVKEQKKDTRTGSYPIATWRGVRTRSRPGSRGF